MTEDLSKDIRWRRFHDTSWICPCCGSAHSGVFDLACSKPDFWQGSEEQKPNSEVLYSSNILTQDFCILDSQHFFVRCVLPLPIIGATDQHFGYGVWSTLSEKNFKLYVDTFDSGQQGDLGPWFGWFSNQLKGYPDTRNLKCQVHPRAERKRPWIELEDTAHPLAMEQQQGITFDRLLEIYALHDHDMRDSLSST
jgi:hypothetical protein